MSRIQQLVHWIELRRGSLHQCIVCSEVWHLDGNAERMTHVHPKRLPLVLEWNKAEIVLPPSVVITVESIGPTPPDSYGNGIEQRVTPCEVVTHSGERFRNAVICVQLDAPVQEHMKFRLGTEISQVKESLSALPRKVREASSRAPEMRMGFSPTLIVMPDNRQFVMNGMTNFMEVPGYAASEARLADGSYFSEIPTPSLIQTPNDVTFFVVDGDPGWVAEARTVVGSTSAPKRWLRKLSRRE
ncbi:hypothetical protein ACFOOT_20495 [Novosphingobium pokkalii]|uniref:Uncharacterized protein n=1 Tax=Novosphingobium pokkalii TaxID=1770194 RepID=A0ABV7V8S3_9SPHN